MRNEKGQDIDVTALFFEKLIVCSGGIGLRIAAPSAGCTNQTLPLAARRPDV
jgi:hypothetical protein